MSKTATVRARISPELKKSAEQKLHGLGLEPAEAIRIFYHQIDLQGGLPFPVRLPNAKTAKTLRESRAGKGVKKFASARDLLDDLQE